MKMLIYQWIVENHVFLDRVKVCFFERFFLSDPVKFFNRSNWVGCCNGWKELADFLVG